MENEKKSKINPHLVIWIVIGVVLLISVIRLIIWNIGTKSDYDPNNISDDFDTEALDVIYKVDRSKIEGFEDDGVTTVLMLGNNPLTDRTDEGGIAAMVASQTGATVYNAGFANTCLAALNKEYSDNCAVDAFSLYYLTKSMCTGDYSLQDAALEAGLVPAEYTSSLEVLKNIDYSKVDVLTIFYDARDYLQMRNLYDDIDALNTSTYTGALRASALQIKEAYPHIRIIFMTPYFAYYVHEDGVAYSGDTANLGRGTMPDYLLYSIDVANECLFTVVDNYYGTIHEENASEYLIDNIQINDKGREALATRLAETIGIPEK